MAGSYFPKDKGSFWFWNLRFFSSFPESVEFDHFRSMNSMLRLDLLILMCLLSWLSWSMLPDCHLNELSFLSPVQ